MNALDVAFAVLLLLAAWLGGKIRSLRLIGIAFVIVVTPWLSHALSPALGHWIVTDAGGAGLKPHQNQIAWWLIALAVTALLLFIFNGFSRMAEAVYLKHFDKGLGALFGALIIAGLLSLNLENLSRIKVSEWQSSLKESWTYQNLKLKKKPEWVEKTEDKIKELQGVKKVVKKKVEKIRR